MRGPVGRRRPQRLMPMSRGWWERWVRPRRRATQSTWVGRRWVGGKQIQALVNEGREERRRRGKRVTSMVLR